MPFIFISYSHRDRPFMKDFVPQLRTAYGHNAIWYDEDLQGGDKWQHEIQRNISQSDIFVILLSPEAMQSKHCRDEWEQALAEKKPILPVLVRDNTPIVPELEPYQYVNMAVAGITQATMLEFIGAVNKLKPARVIPVVPPVVGSSTAPTPIRRKQKTASNLYLPLLGLLLILFVVGIGLFWRFRGAAPAIPPTASPTIPAPASITPLLLTATQQISASTTPVLASITPALPVLPTRPSATTSGTAALHVFRTQGGVAVCNVQPAAFSVANFSVTFALGAGETYMLAEEFPDVAAIAPGTCVCLRNRDIPGTYPQQCTDANSSATKRAAGDWFNAQMTLTFENQSCVLTSGATEKRCF